jgi:hypothetical protein
MNHYKIKKDDVLTILNTSASRASLCKMGIGLHITRRNVRISQVSPHGVSFLTSKHGVPANEQSGGAVELHLGIVHVENVFGLKV